LPAAFMRDTPGEWLSQYPRYTRALRTRIERLRGQYGKDQKHTALLQSLAAPLWELLEARPGLLLQCAPAMRYRWMLEELRVSLFAQNLGTRMPVSEKRLREQWQTVARWLTENPR
jgi:ATP-dependent RNA helicase HrpA